MPDPKIRHAFNPVAHSSLQQPPPDQARSNRRTLERRISELRKEVSTLARAGDDRYRIANASTPRAQTLRGRMDALNMQREHLEAQLHDRFPAVVARPDERCTPSVHAALKRVAGIMRNRRASAMLRHASHRKVYAPRALALKGSTLSGSDKAKLLELEELAAVCRETDSAYREAVKPLHQDAEYRAMSLREFNLAYNAAAPSTRNAFIDFLTRNLPQRPTDPATMIEDISRLHGPKQMPPQAQLLIDDFFLLAPDIRGSHYTVQLALAGKLFQRLQDVVHMEEEAEADPSEHPSGKLNSDIYEGNRDIEALMRALRVHAPRVSDATDFDGITVALEAYRGALARLEDPASDGASSTRTEDADAI